MKQALIFPASIYPGYILWERYPSAASFPVTLKKFAPGFYHSLVSLTFRLQTGAAAGNRFPVLALLDTDGNVVLRLPISAVIGASTTAWVTYLKSTAGVNAGANNNFLAPFPTVFIPDGFALQLIVEGAQAGDSVDSVAAIYEVVDATKLGLDIQNSADYRRMIGG